MNTFAAILCLFALGNDSPLAPGDHERTVTMGETKRTYLVHVPKNYDPKTASPVVLALHGAFTDGRMMKIYSGLDQKSDDANFIVVYPNGTGTGVALFWNSGGGVGDKTRPNDVEFIGKVLDDLATVVTVNPKKVYATGLSNGGMMSYKLANDLSDRIAAIAPVAGTMTFDKAQPKRPVPVLHFHGAADTVVPVTGAKPGLAKSVLPFKSVDATIAAWVECNHCQKDPQSNDSPDTAKDGTKIHQKTYAPDKEGAEVILYMIEGGGHTWPGAKMAVSFLGNTTHNLSANDVIWEFFTKHELK